MKDSYLSNFIIILSISFAAFFVIYASSLGISDDEAYYWVLSQRPQWAYAFHPPLVAWLICFSEKSIGFHSPGVTRIPAILCATGVLYLSVKWITSGTEFQKKSVQPRLGQAVLLLLSFAGFFSLSWMIVPDLPLFFGWTLSFVSCWKICENPKNRFAFLNLSLGILIALLSKYSGLFVPISVILCFFTSLGKGMERRKLILTVLMITVIGLAPIIYWNYKHEWGSILYQIRDRHSGGEISVLRFVRFWLLQILFAGPLIVFSTFFLIWRFLLGSKTIFSENKLNLFVLFWMAPPAAVYWIQPLFSDFKPHWCFIVWWPMFLYFSKLLLEGGIKLRTQRWIQLQITSGWLLNGLILLICQVPVVSFILENGLGYKKVDPRIDVSNDFYGWDLLRKYFLDSKDLKWVSLPVVGSRYQTASQAAYSLHGISQVAQIPLEIKSMKSQDEWPQLKVSDTLGPHWPVLKSKVLYVADSRYQEEPKFLNSNCRKITQLEKRRSNFLAKKIELWMCIPAG